MEPGEYDYIFKLLAIGDSNSGKSALLLKYTDTKWNESFVPTIGVDFVIKIFLNNQKYFLQKIKNIEIQGKSVKLQIWDTAGEERFKNIISSYYRRASGILLLYNITDRESFESLNSWLIDIEKNTKKDVCKILVGTNCDLEDERKVTYQEGKEFATKNGMKFIEVSVENNININEAFDILLEDIMNKISNKKEKKDDEKIVKSPIPDNKKNEKCNII